MAGGDLVDSFRKSLDEGDVCMIADAAVTMEEDFLFDIISDLEPTASVYCKESGPGSRKSARQIAQRKRPESLKVEAEQHRAEMEHRGDICCMSPSSSMSVASSCSSSTLSTEDSAGWSVMPVVTPQQMHALGQQVKEQRSSSVLSDSAPTKTTSPKSGVVGG